jgi:hypothetical protein
VDKVDKSRKEASGTERFGYLTGVSNVTNNCPYSRFARFGGSGKA